MFCKKISVFILVSTSLNCLQAMQIQERPLFVPEKLGNLALYHDDNGFKVVKGDRVVAIQPAFMDKELRGLSKEKLEMLINAGAYLALNKFENSEDYSLRLRGRIKGGGPIAGAVSYWATKALCYGVASAAAGTAVVATGGAAGAATGILTASSTLGLGAGATLVGSAIAGAGAAEGAAVATAGVVVGAGGLAGAVAAVETASLGVSTFFTLCPFLP